MRPHGSRRRFSPPHHEGWHWCACACLMSATLGRSCLTFEVRASPTQLMAVSGGPMMEASVRAFFERYESFFNRSLGGDMDPDEAAALYASEFIAASPAGVMTGKNDDQLKQVMAQGYARYRAMGTKDMRIR